MVWGSTRVTLAWIPVMVAMEPASAEVARIWLTHRTSDPSKIVVNWTSAVPGPSMVRYGTTEPYDHEVRVATVFHHHTEKTETTENPASCGSSAKA